MANYQDRQIHEECGVFGVFGVEKAASLTYYGLHSLQHRGQEGCGIVSVDNRTFHRVKGEGLVTEVFNEDNLRTLTGNMAIGHVRYSTTGGGGIDNVQPFMFMHSTGDFALAHNGNLVNSFQLKTFLEERGSLFHSTSDSEIFAHLIKKETDSRDRIFPILEALNTDLVCDAINTAMRELFLQIVYGRTQSAFSDDGLRVGAGLEDLGKGLRSQVGTMYGTKLKGVRYLEMAEGYVLKLALDKDNQVCGYQFLSLGKMMDAIKKGMSPNEAYEKNVGTYGRFKAEDGAVAWIDPRKQ